MQRVFGRHPALPTAGCLLHACWVTLSLSSRFTEYTWAMGWDGVNKAWRSGLGGAILSYLQSKVEISGIIFYPCPTPVWFVCTWCERPLCRTLFLAISHRSHVLSFHTWAAMAYSSISASCKEQQTALLAFVKLLHEALLLLSCSPWCSGTAWDRQWTGTHTGLCAETLAEGSWSTEGRGCCCSEGTWRSAPAPGSTCTATLDSAEEQRRVVSVTVEANGFTADVERRTTPFSGWVHARCCRLWGRRRPGGWWSRLLHSEDGTGRCWGLAPCRETRIRTFDRTAKFLGCHSSVWCSRCSCVGLACCSESFPHVSAVGPACSFGEGLTCAGCWAPWCWRTCRTGSMCRAGCPVTSTPQASGSCRWTCGRCAWTRRPRCRNPSPTAQPHVTLPVWRGDNGKREHTYVFQEHVHRFVLLGIHRRFVEGKENVLQNLGKVGD